MARQTAPHLVALRKNLGDITRLLELHARVASERGGRHATLQVLDRSAVVLLVACWEAYVEDLAVASFDWLLNRCDVAKAFPSRVRARASKHLRDSKDELAVWELAGDGWRGVLSKHRDESVQSVIGTFNTPRTAQVDTLFDSLLGMGRISSAWRWPAMPVQKARERLDQLVTMRGDIAHRVRHTRPLRRPEVDRSVEFINRLAIQSHNAIVSHLGRMAGASPWASTKYTTHDQRLAWERRRSDMDGRKRGGDVRTAGT